VFWIVPSVTVTVTICFVTGGVGVWRFTVADPTTRTALAADVAVTVTFAGLGSVAGAMYSPLPLIEPLPLPITAQVTV